MNFISKELESQKNFFNKRMMTFPAIGIMAMIFLVSSYNTYAKGSGHIENPFIPIIYWIYVDEVVWGHINPQLYFLMILGKIGNEREKYAKNDAGFSIRGRRS